MSMFALGRDIAAELPGYAVALRPTNLTAGGSGDNTAANGETIDVTTLPGGRAESVAFLIGAVATLAATKTLVVAAKIQTSDDGSTWTDAKTLTGLITLEGPTGGGTLVGNGKLGVSLEYCKAKVRCVVTPDLSAANTDTATVFAMAVFGGSERLP